MAFRNTALNLTAGAAAIVAARLWVPAASGSAPPQAPATATVPVQRAGEFDLPPSAFVQTSAQLLGAHLGEDIDSTSPQRPALRLCTVVVLLPDPIDSRLDWQFDAGLESVRRAFETSGFVLERFWLPWSVDADTTLRKRDRRHKPFALRREYPGVLLFRRSTERSDVVPPDTTLAIAYVVGETPTSGIHQVAFDAAMRERDELRARFGACPEVPDASRASDVLRGVGPTFSGTIESLGKRLGPWLARVTGHSPPNARQVTVISGSANAPANRYALTRRDPARISFAATMNPVDALITTLCDSVLHRLGYEPGEVAFLEESSTLFGAAASSAVELQHDSARHAGTGEAHYRDACARRIALPFPMSISRLRAEYARHPVSASAELPAMRQPSARVPLDLQDPASSFESPPALSDLTAPALERVMDDIGQTLLAHRIRVAVVLATDVRDGVFVANEVKRRLRDLQLVLIGSHVLYLRPEFNEQLRGALVVSTYPLVLENQYWTRIVDPRGRDDSTARRLVFTNELSEGAYNAAIMQLAPIVTALARRDASPSGAGEGFAAHPMTADECLSSMHARLVDYRAPREADTPYVHARDATPPIWVTTVGRYTLAPVATYPRDRSVDPAFVATGCEPSPHAVFAQDSPATVFSPWEKFLVALVVGTIALSVIWMATPSLQRRASAVPHVRRTDRDVCNSVFHEQIAHALRPIAMFCATAPLLLVPLRPLTHRWALPRFWVWLVIVVGAVGALLAAWTSFRALMRSEAEARVSNWTKGRGWGVFLLGVGLTAAVAFFIADTLLSPTPQTAIFFTRALQLGSGVSPIVPLVAGGAFLLLWTQEHMHRSRHARRHFAYESGARSWQSGSLEGDGPSRVRRCLVHIADGPRGWVIVALTVLLDIWIALELNRPLDTLALRHPRVFDLLIRALLILLITLSAWMALRFARIWGVLRVELWQLEQLSFVEAFRRLPASLMPLGRLAPLDSPRRSDIGAALDAAITSRAARLARLRPALWQELYGPISAETVRTSDPNDLPSSYTDAARKLFARLALPDHSAWMGRRDERPTEAREAAEDVAALFTVDYIGWVIRHLRHLAITLLASVALGTLFLAAYPLEPDTLIRLCFFGVSGAAVLVIAVVLVQMNRHPVLSRIMKTPAGEVTWDAPFIANLAAVVGIPLLALLGSQFPEVRDFLFGWLAPVLRTVGRS